MFSVARPGIRLDHKSARRPAFTLVELLVVIGIIAILIGILLPTLGRARESASQVKCMANMRQIGSALLMYTGQYKGSLPIGVVANGDAYAGNGNGSYRGESCDWTTLLMFVMQRNAKGIGEDQEAVKAGDTGNIKQVFICPSVYIPSLTASPRISHYSAHPRLMPNLKDFDGYLTTVKQMQMPVAPYKITRIKRPSEIGVIFEGVVDYGTGVGQGYLAQATCNALNRDGLGRAPLFMTDDYGRVATTVTASTPVELRRTADGWTAAKDLNKDSFANRGNIRFRHMKDSQMNVLMVDGHVEKFGFKASSQSTDLLHKNICVPPPQ